MVMEQHPDMTVVGEGTHAWSPAAVPVSWCVPPSTWTITPTPPCVRDPAVQVVIFAYDTGLVRPA
jgi:hypothetical protein